MEIKYERVNYSNERFKRNLDFLTSKMNITKSKIEEDLGIGGGALSRYCKGDEKAPKPSIELVNSLAKVFEVTIDELINEDLEKKESEEVEVNERNEIKFCKKLISDTKENKIEWGMCIFYESPLEDYYGSIIKQDPYENSITFCSDFLGTMYPIEEVKLIIANITSNVRVLIAQLPYENEENYYTYELYFIKNNQKVIKACASYTLGFIPNEVDYDKGSNNILKNLYDEVTEYIYFGKERFEKEEIFDDYLYPIPF